MDGKPGYSALQHASTVAFDASGSSGSGIRFGLDFGSGQGADLPTATHVYTSSGTFKARLIVTDSLGRTDQVSVDVMVRSVVDNWNHGFYNQNAQRYESRALNITQQNGRSVSGQYRHPEGWTTPFTGEVSASRGATLNLTDGTITFASDAEGGFNATLTSLTVKMRGGSADGQTLTFVR